MFTLLHRRASAQPRTEADLLRLGNVLLDELFRASPAGPVPMGRMRGTLLAFPGSRAARPIAAFARALLWQGKVVDAEQTSLKNLVTPLRLRAIKAAVSTAASWVDGDPTVLIDYSRTSRVAGMVRDEIRLVGPGLYLGVVWMWRRRVGWFALRPQGTK
ncbi:hypothetical protein [Cellulomonas sp. URHD0024]|uniref:hypothetical protein n=1 Tax=Cellulomonas sp. URHD0024 TaxID=1302620 RepID=UPI0006871944|nr:hypothetical protein [Cellulomonas sp. URHD0024]